MTTLFSPRFTSQASVDQERFTLDEQYRSLCEPVAQKVAASSTLIPEIANLVAQYESDMNWYRALTILNADFPNAIPKTIPPLPLNLLQIRNEAGSIQGSLYLIPRGTLNELVAFVNAYGQMHLATFDGKNPFHLNFFEVYAPTLGNILVDKDQWVWISDDVLEESRNRTYQEQTQMIAKLNSNFKIPSLREVVAVLFFRKIATGESALAQSYTLEHSRFTRVQDTVTNPFTNKTSHLTVGGFKDSGVLVTDFTEDNSHDSTVGVMVCQK